MARRYARLVLAATLLIAGSLPARAQDLRGLPDPVAKVITSRSLPPESFSAYVQAVGEKTPLVSFNADTPRNPASVIKLLTTWAALQSLGPTFRWRTEAFFDGRLADGRLAGDLVLKGHGDPYLTIERLWLLLRELRRAGLRHIDGDLVIDNSWFAREETDPGAFDGQPYKPYNTLPDALLLNFQAVNFTFQPDPVTGRVAILSDPELANLEIRNNMRLFRGNCSDKRGGINMTVVPGAEPAVSFSGQLANNCSEYQLTRALPDGPTYVYGAFRSLWEEQGGTLGGKLRIGQVPPGKKPAVRFESLPLAEIIRPVNKFSNNVMTRQIYLTLGAERSGPPATMASGREALGAILQGAGLDFPELVIDNGAGLSRTTRIAARSLGRMLQHAAASPYRSEFEASLSIAGLDGTTRRRYRRDPMAGRLHLKTGSLNGVTAVAGFVRSESGKEYVVVAITNRSGPPYGGGMEAQQALLRWVYRR
jgi:D-alanyl-D-alanine carboxypeptidase/D-alanyl-D-alanine-endopeptidase (penicillin-binding protein 4)